MNSMYFKAFIGVAIITFTACSSPQPEQKAVPVDMVKPATTIAIELSALASDQDPVCGMSLKEGVNDTATVKGKLYGFCSEGCKKEYVLANQEKE